MQHCNPSCSYRLEISSHCILSFSFIRSIFNAYPYHCKRIVEGHSIPTLCNFSTAAKPIPSKDCRLQNSNNVCHSLTEGTVDSCSLNPIATCINSNSKFITIHLMPIASSVIFHKNNGLPNTYLLHMRFGSFINLYSHSNE